MSGLPQKSIAVVTGANKGLAYEMVRGLAQAGVQTILTARDERRGKEAVAKLHQEGLTSVEFHPLEVSSRQSAAELAEWIKEKYGGLDILVNNAGVFQTPVDRDAAILAIDINYRGTQITTEALTPLFKSSPEGSRVVNVASGLGHLSHFNADTRKELEGMSNSSDIDAFVDRFLRDVGEGTWKEKGWPQTFHSYTLSKAAQIAYSRIKAEEFKTRPEGSKVYVTVMCPGFCDTDLSQAAVNKTGIRTPQKGAETVIWLALLPASELAPLAGKMFRDKEVVAY